MRQLMSRFPSRSVGDATVLYHSGTMTQQVHSFELDSTAAAAAGIAKIRESVGFTDSVQTCLFTESGRGSRSSTALVYSDREDQLRAMYAWLNRCGVSVRTLLPTSVAIMNNTADLAIKAKAETAVVYLGADVSVIAYATEDGLALVRLAQIGYRKLIDGYRQAFESGDESGENEVDGYEPCVHGASVARESLERLFEHGIPLETKDVDGVELRHAVLPALAPVLQRLCIEIKQTFRFGLGGAAMPKNLMLCGEGAMIPQLGKAIGQHIDMYIQINGDAGSDVCGAFGVGTIERVVSEAQQGSRRVAS